MSETRSDRREVGDGPRYTALELSRAARRLDMALAGMHMEISGRLDMTPAELLAVAWLGMEGDLGPTDLAHRLHMRTGAVTALLDRLEARGRIARTPHTSDRRKVVIRLTDAGRGEAMAHLGPMVDEAVALARSISAEDRERIGAYLDDLAAIVARHARAEPAR